VRKGPDVKHPNLGAKLRNAVGAVVDLARNGVTIVSDEEYNNRMSKCLTCPNWNPGLNMGLGSCAKCGCCKFKPKFKAMSCPDKLW
jgi:hypothetical protein